MTTVRSISQQLLGGKIWPIALLIVSITLAVCMLGIGLNNRYTFDDEFNGPAGAPPDPTKWSYDIGNGGWGNNELQSYTDSRQNSFLDGKGHLIIRATKPWTGPHAAVLPAFTTTRPGSQPCTISPKSKDIGKPGSRLTASVACGQHGGC